MLGIPSIWSAEIAEMPTKHSWLQPLLKLSERRYEIMESQVEAWVESKAQELYPNLDRVGRMVRETLGPLLEKEAIQMWLEQNPWKGLHLYAPQDEYDAMAAAAQEVMYASKEEKEAAMEMFEMITSGELTPPESITKAYQNQK